MSGVGFSPFTSQAGPPIIIQGSDFKRNRSMKTEIANFISARSETILKAGQAAKRLGMQTTDLLSHAFILSGKDLLQAKNKIKTAFGSSNGVYKVARLSKFAALGLEQSHVSNAKITANITRTANGWLDFMDGVAIIGDFTSVLDGTVKKKIQNKDIIGLSKQLIAFVGINVPCTVILLDKFRLVDLEKISKAIGTFAEFSITSFIRKSVLALNAINIAEAVIKIRSGEDAKVKDGIFQLTCAISDIALQLFYLSGSTSVPGLVVLGLLSAGTGLARLIVQESSKDDSEKGLLDRVDGVYNLAKVISSCVEDLIFTVIQTSGDSADVAVLRTVVSELKVITDLVSLRGVADRWSRFKEEYKTDRWSKAKYLLLLAGNICHLTRGLQNHGIDYYILASKAIGSTPIALVAQQVSLKVVGNSFVFLSSIIALGMTAEKMWSNPDERCLRNYLSLSKEIGKVGVFIFSGSLGICGSFAATPYFLAFATIANGIALAKTVYDMNQEKKKALRR